MQRYRKTILEFLLISLFAILINSFLEKSLIIRKTEAFFRGVISFGYDERYNHKNYLADEIFLVDPRNDSTNRVIKSINEFSPKLIVLTFAIDDLIANEVRKNANVLFPLPSEDYSIYSLGKLSFGFKEDDEFNSILVKRLGFEKKWYNNDDIPIRYLGHEEKFKTINPSGIIKGKIVVVGSLNGYGESLFATALGTMNETIFIANEIFSLMQYGLEKKSIIINLAFVFFFFILYNLFVRNRIMNTGKVFLIFLILINILLLLSFTSFLFIKFNIFIHPLYCFTLPVYNLLIILFSNRNFGLENISNRSLKH